MFGGGAGEPRARLTLSRMARVAYDAGVRIPAAFLRTRPVLLLLALVSAMALGESGRARCGMHGLGAIGTSGTLPSAAASADEHSAMSHASAGHHGEHGDRHERGPQGDGQRDDQRGDRTSDTGCDCSCIGDCSVPCGTAEVPTTPTLRVAIVAAAPLHPFAAPSEQATAREPDRLLPFANGPPLV